MDARLRDLVWRRVGDRSEYCHLPQDAALLTFHVEHIIARQHRGPTEANNLALSCNLCNAFKGPNLSSIDPETGDVVSLFHPRSDSWAGHFSFRGGEIVGLTPTGRATVVLLNMNEPDRVELREQWLLEGDLS